MNRGKGQTYHVYFGLKNRDLKEHKCELLYFPFPTEFIIYNMGWGEYSPSISLQEEKPIRGSLHSSETLGRMRQENSHQPWTYHQDPIQGFPSQTPVQNLLGHLTLLCSWDCKKRQSRGLEKKGSFVYLGLMVNRQPTHLKQRFFVLHLNKPKIPQTSDITYHQVLLQTLS